MILVVLKAQTIGQLSVCHRFFQLRKDGNLVAKVPDSHMDRNNANLNCSGDVNGDCYNDWDGGCNAFAIFIFQNYSIA